MRLLYKVEFRPDDGSHMGWVTRRAHVACAEGEAGDDAVKLARLALSHVDDIASHLVLKIEYIGKVYVG